MVKRDKTLLSGVSQRLKQWVPSKLKKQPEKDVVQPDLTVAQPTKQKALGKPMEKPIQQSTKKKSKKAKRRKR